MSEQKDGGPALCAWCDQPSHIRQGRILLCVKHYRFSGMRSRAKRDGKTVPTRDQLEAIIPEPFNCPACRRPMQWLRTLGASSQVTLQHDRSGELKLICLACNTRHAQHPGDSFYDIPEGKKRCPNCDQVLPLAGFAVDRSRPMGRKSFCRACSSVVHTLWRRKNRDHYNAKQRARRAAQA